MEVSAPATKYSALHPVFWMAGISVTLLSLAGIASLTGLLPARPAPMIREGMWKLKGEPVTGDSKLNEPAPLSTGSTPAMASARLGSSVNTNQATRPPREWRFHRRW